MTGAFLIEVGDLWTRMVAAIAALGAVGIGITWGERRSLLRGDRSSIALGLGSAAALYVVAATLVRFEPVARQAAVMNQWRSGHSTPFLVVTVAIAVVGEEIFWRAAFLRRMMRELPVVRAALLAALRLLGRARCLGNLASSIGRPRRGVRLEPALPRHRRPDGLLGFAPRLGSARRRNRAARLNR